MSIFNKYTVGLGVGAGILGSQIISSSRDIDGSNPIISAENNRLMLQASFDPARYTGTEQFGASTLSMGLVGLGAGALLGGGSAFAARRLFSEDAGGITGKIARGLRTRNDMTDPSPLGSMWNNSMRLVSRESPRTMLGITAPIAGGVFGAAVGGYVGASIFDRGTAAMTHNYLNIAGNSDVQGATTQRQPVSVLNALEIGGVSTLAFMGHRVVSGMARNFINTEKGANMFKNKYIRGAAMTATAAPVSVGLAAATAITINSKLNSINTNPNASVIEGLRY